MILFNSALVLIGITLIMFYYTFEKLFILLKDERNLKYSKFTKPLGVFSGVFFSGVGFVPHDFRLRITCFFCKWGFLDFIFFVHISHNYDL